MGLKKIEHCVLEIHYIIRHEDFIEIGSHLAQITFDHSWHANQNWHKYHIILSQLAQKSHLITVGTVQINIKYEK